MWCTIHCTLFYRFGVFVPFHALGVEDAVSYLPYTLFNPSIIANIPRLRMMDASNLKAYVPANSHAVKQ
jgi:hypothetical protein